MPDFRTTRWSLVAAAVRSEPGPEARAALADLCELYWPPVYAFIRRRGYDAALDLTQEFFARLLEKQGLAGVDPARGRFRSYLLGACRHFLSSEHERATAVKRGGGRTTWSLTDAERHCIASDRTPEEEFERKWALTLLDHALSDLRTEYSDRAALFEALVGTLTGEAAAYADIASKLGMTEGAVKVAAHRLRQRYRERLRAAVADTVSTPDEVDDEIRALFSAFG